MNFMKNKTNNLILWSLIIYSIFCALNIGISWDELAHIDRGNERLKYLFSFGSYDYLDYRDQRFYPGFYNTLATFFTKMIPKKYEIETLHLINLSFSFFAIVGISKISSELFNKNVGKIVFILCFLNPIFFGHMSINQKDMIIAFSNIWASYLILRYLKNQSISERRNQYVLLGGLVIGLGQGVRMVFISTLLPIILFSIIEILFLKKIISKNFSYKKLTIDFLKIFIISYMIMVSCWPDTHQNILILPFQLFIESLNNPFGVPFGLLNGEFYQTFNTPKYYLFTNLLYKSPEFILICYLFFVFLVLKYKNFFHSKFTFFNTKIFLLLFIIIFPNLLILITPYRIFDGLRLFLYIIPYICIIPALSIYYLIENFKNKSSKVFLIPIVSFFIYYIFIFLSLTPYHYTYLNSFNGDYSKAYKKFENDYWAVSLKELINQISLRENLLNKKEVKIAFCGVAFNNVDTYFKKINNFNFQKVNYLNESFDYIIMTNRTVYEEDSKLLNAKTCFDRFSGSDIITVKRNGLVLSTMRKIIK